MATLLKLLRDTAFMVFVVPAFVLIIGPYWLYCGCMNRVRRRRTT